MSRRPRVPAAQLEPYLVPVPHPRTPDWRELALKPPIFSAVATFGNDQPLEIEVGFGKGLFLLEQSQQRPAVNFLGIEIERQYVLGTAARLAQRQIPNVRLACTDARWFLQSCLPAAIVQAVHIYFPDPWWKQRHRKRKLLTPAFAAQCVRVLRSGGELHFASDVREYFNESCRILAEHAELTAQPVAATDDTGLTHFERKYRREGREIYRACWIKK